MDARGSGENRSFVYTTGRFRDVRGLDAFSVSVTTLGRGQAREGFYPRGWEYNPQPARLGQPN